jgi:hypothetical protein
MAQRLSRIAAGIAIVTVLGVTALVTRNVLWPDDPDASLQRNDGKVMGDMAGYVGRVDREARTVDISTSPLGIRPVVLLVTNETAIVVNGKQGAIGDLWKDLPVRVLYEVRDNTRYATSIQVTAGDSLAATPAAAKDSGPASATPTPTKEPQAPSVATSPAPPTAPQPVAPAPVAPATPPKPPAPPAVATKPTPVAPAPVPVAPPPAVVTAPRAVVTAPPAVVTTPPAVVTAPPAVVTAPPAVVTAPPAAVAAPPAPVAQPPAPRVAEPAVPRVPVAATPSTPSTESASVGSSRAAQPAPTESETDGSAAIDWLLKGTGRR